MTLMVRKNSTVHIYHFIQLTNPYLSFLPLTYNAAHLAVHN